MINGNLRPHKILILLGIIYLFFLVGIYFLQEKIIFLPSSKIFWEIDARKLEAEEFNLKIDGNTTINGYFVPNNKESETIIFFHGNNGNISNNFARIAIAKKLGLNIAVFDYRGYGKSTGTIKSESDIYKDAETVIKYLEEKHKIPRKNLILWGQSLGGAVATEMAHRHSISKLILESTFSSLENVTPDVFKYLIPEFVKKYKFNNLEKVAEIESPIMIIHSSEDEIINFQNGLDLFDKVKSREKSELLEIKGDHNGGFLSNFEEYEKDIRKFLNK